LTNCLHIHIFAILHLQQKRFFQFHS
jgi:hypothetical protein